MPETLLLNGAVQAPDTRDQQIRELKTRVIELEDELATERRRQARVLSAANEVKATLAPLYGGLKKLFGDFEDMGASGDVAPQSSAPQKSVLWESWKDKLGGLPAKAIDVLLLHGEMSAAQLRIHLHCRLNSVYDAMSKMKKAGIISKNNGKYSLKQG